MQSDSLIFAEDSTTKTVLCWGTKSDVSPGKDVYVFKRKKKCLLRKKKGENVLLRRLLKRHNFKGKGENVHFATKLNLLGFFWGGGAFGQKLKK